MGELAAPHEMSLPAITKHVGVLVEAGLVSRRKVGRTVVCALRQGSLTEAQAWLVDLDTYWQGSLDRLEQLLTAPEPEEKT